MLWCTGGRYSMGINIYKSLAMGWVGIDEMGWEGGGGRLLYYFPEYKVRWFSPFLNLTEPARVLQNPGWTLKKTWRGVDVSGEAFRPFFRLQCVVTIVFFTYGARYIASCGGGCTRSVMLIRATPGRRICWN